MHIHTYIHVCMHRSERPGDEVLLHVFVARLPNVQSDLVMTLNQPITRTKDVISRYVCMHACMYACKYACTYILTCIIFLHIYIYII